MADNFVEDILKSWKLSCLIPKFRDQGVDEDTFKSLDETSMAVFIPNKGLRKIFELKYDQYMTRPVHDDLSTEHMDQSASEVDLTEDPIKSEFQSSFDIEFILSETSTGKELIDIYNAAGKLHYHARNSLANILIEFLITQSDDYTIDNDVLDEIADAIIFRFPNESKDLYYNLAGDTPDGKLVETYLSVRKKLLNKSKLKKSMKGAGPSRGESDSRPSRSSGGSQAPLPEWVEVERSSNEEVVNLKWESHTNSLLQGLPNLLANEKFVDTTIMVEGQVIKCHKLVLSSYSSYFQKMLESSPSNHPIIFLADLNFWEIQALIDFMYMGELNIEESKLPRLFEVASKLNIEGLANINACDNEGGGQVMESESLDHVETEDPLSVSPMTSSNKRKQSFTKPSVPIPTYNDTLQITKKTKLSQDMDSSKDQLRRQDTNFRLRGKTKFQYGWVEEFPWVQSVENDPHSAKCSLCKSVFSVQSMGRQAVFSHFKGKKHQANTKNKEKTAPLQTFLKQIHKSNDSSQPAQSASLIENITLA